MNNYILYSATIAMVLLAGCTQQEPDWKATTDAQQKELQEQKEKQEAEERRMAELEKTIDGLKKSDTPFSLVLADPPADTVSKGLDFTSLLRVNPSGVVLTKEMIALDYISGKQFFRVGPNQTTKASYIKQSDYFSMKDFEADKNSSGEMHEGQYLTTITANAEEAVWVDSRMAFVGAYVDKEAKNQLVSTESFKTVMMPLPAEGLSPWCYPHASFLLREKRRQIKVQNIWLKGSVPYTYRWMGCSSRPKMNRTPVSIRPRI